LEIESRIARWRLEFTAQYCSPVQGATWGEAHGALTGYTDAEHARALDAIAVACENVDASGVDPSEIGGGE
jgi:hypothetical protein